MSIVLRAGTPADAAVCGPICFRAFKSINDTHNFPPDFPSPEIATGVLTMLLSHGGFYSVVAEKDGKIVGSNFLDERGPIAGVGPITVDPSIQNQTIGKSLMLAVLDRARARKAAGVRLLQSAFHNRSLCLYTKLGFDSRETVSKIDGTALNLKLPGYEVRPARTADVAACNALCRRVHGHDRGGELEDAIKAGTGRVVEHLGEITAYASDIASLHTDSEIRKRLILLEFLSIFVPRKIKWDACGTLRVCGVTRNSCLTKKPPDQRDAEY
jgi:predicted N-acetyltransferase YhbS